jgi:hypothetical protein
MAGAGGVGMVTVVASVTVMDADTVTAVQGTATAVTDTAATEHGLAMVELGPDTVVGHGLDTQEAAVPVDLRADMPADSVVAVSTVVVVAVSTVVEAVTAAAVTGNLQVL